jgi:hypothetical protein
LLVARAVGYRHMLCLLHVAATGPACVVLPAGGELVVAVGLWVANSLLLMHWPSSTQQQPQQQLSAGCVVELQEEQARSAAVLPVGGEDVLLVGTNSGSVLMWQVEQQQQQQQQAGTWQLQHGRAAKISSTSVSLLPMQLPAATSADAAAAAGSSSIGSNPGSTVASVYAHAGAGAVIRPIPGLVAARQRQQQAHQGGSSSSVHAFLPTTDCLLVSRVCGSEACLTAAPVASADMPPHSLAWVSPSSKLCFGELEPLHKLRWRARGLPGSPLAMALHKPTNTLVLLMQADNGCSSQVEVQGAGRQQQQQQLVLLDARSLAVLLVLGLAEGHSYTCLAVLDLPCTSQQQQQQQQRQQQPGSSAASEAGTAGGHFTGANSSSNSRPGLRPVIVLGSCLNMAVSPAGANVDAAGAGTSSASAAAAAAVPEELQVGMLSFFELQASMSAAGQAAGAAAAGPASSAQQQMRYALLLHGMTPLPVTPACVCTVMPELLHEQAGKDAAAGSAGDGNERSAAQQQQATAAAAAASKAAAEAAGQGAVCLAVGSEAGVSLLQVLVDDAGRQQQMVVQQQLAAAAEVSGGGELRGAAPGAAGWRCTCL